MENARGIIQGLYKGLSKISPEGKKKVAEFQTLPRTSVCFLLT
jgi:hypothetical protein